MSRCFLKADVIFDTNYGETGRKTFYICEDNCTDYRKIVDEDGCKVTMEGTDSYCDMLSYVLRIEDYDNYPVESVHIETCHIPNLPLQIRECFDL